MGSPGVHTIAVDLRFWLDGYSLRPPLSPPRSFWERVNMAGVLEWNETSIYSMWDARGRESETGNGHDNGKANDEWDQWDVTVPDFDCV